ncbi:MAG: DUF3553 domain-containing protein [Nitrospirae bacterium]|nr:DUF3553 domain-containing protein [Nitrospirota bacterium]
MTRHTLLDDLNLQQREAVIHTKGPLLILAGAGSGKTRVITYKFAYLMDVVNVPPTSIIAMTFTNKAANEMRERVEKLVGKSHKGLWLGTFHAISNRILRREVERLGFKRDFVIYDEDDSCSLIRSILKEFGVHEALYKGIASKIASLKASLIGPQEFLESGSGFDFDEKFTKVYVRYQDELKRNNALDFDDLIIHTVRIFEKYPDVLKRYHKEFSHIMVDEFQDTNIAQYRLSKLLTGEQKNVCVVGDDDQSIYRFRGADVRNIIAFEKDFPELKLIKLEQNYRSTQTILDAASGVIAQNPWRKPKKLWTERNGGEKVYHCFTDDENEEARHIAKSIRELYLKGQYSYGDFAILYRTNFQSRVLEEAMRLHGIPYRVIGGVSFYQRKEIKDIISYLKVINNPHDSVSLKRIVNCPPRGIGDATIAKLENEAKKGSRGIFETMRRIAGGSASSTLKNKIADFVKTIEELMLMARREITMPQLIQLVLEKTGYIKGVEEERLENLMELINSSEGKDLQGLIDTASLFSNLDELHAGNFVSLMTLHTVKGLEFPVVFISGVEDGLLPHFHAIKNEDELHEERRLFYVGMTRAKDILILSWAKKRRLYNSLQEREPSRFLNEIPSECYHHIKRQPGATAITSRVLAPAADFLDSSPFAVGVRVRHPKWGTGVVRESYGESNDIKVMVNFPSVGIKRLSLRFANLEKL